MHHSISNHQPRPATLIIHQHKKNMFSSSLHFIPGVDLRVPSQKHRNRKPLQVKAHSMRDEGRSSNLVDSNMKVLKERIKALRAKEMSCRRNEYGWKWNYAPTRAYNFNYKHKKQAHDLSQYFETLGLAGGRISGLTILTATALLCLVSTFMARFHL